MRNRLAAGALALSLLLAAPFWLAALAHTARECRLLPLRAGTAETLEFLENAKYAAAVAAIERAVPPGGALGFVGSRDRERLYWLRHELAPRRVWYVADREGERWVFRDEAAPAEVPRWSVLAGDEGEPPRLVPTDDLVAYGLPPDPRRENRNLTGWVDEPPAGSEARAPFVIRGWCQERGARPCATVHTFVDGRPVLAPVSRVPRPDVCAAISAMGSCERAGWELRPAPPAPGEHELSVLFVSEGGSWRRVGWRFRWTP